MSHAPYIHIVGWQPVFLFSQLTGGHPTSCISTMKDLDTHFLCCPSRLNPKIRSTNTCPIHYILKILILFIRSFECGQFQKKKKSNLIAYKIFFVIYIYIEQFDKRNCLRHFQIINFSVSFSIKCWKGNLFECSNFHCDFYCTPYMRMLVAVTCLTVHNMTL